MVNVPAGAFGFDQTGEAIEIDSNGASNYIRVKTGAWLNIFRRKGVELNDVIKNDLGLYSMLKVDGYGKAKFQTINPAYHLFRPRQNGCTWNPNGRVRRGLIDVDTYPIEYKGEECPDSYWNSCMESLFPEGNGVRDLNASPELRALLMETIATLATGLGNSMHELLHFGLHPLITAADTADTFVVDEERWEDFYAQMVGGTDRPNNGAGFVTLLDSLADEGEPGYDIDIPDADIDANNNYTGDILALFEAMIAKAKTELRTMAKRGITFGAGKRYPVLLCTSPEFRAYEDYLLANSNGNPTLLNYQLLGTDGTPRMMPGVLHYKGIPVVEWDESTWFDEIVGTKCHRVALIAPGTFGVATDVQNLGNAISQSGLRVTQKLDAPYMGKIFFDTTLRWGTALADKDFCVYARNLTPDA
jgi:hypothetical protein